jgi:hypothetical protein
VYAIRNKHEEALFKVESLGDSDLCRKLPFQRLDLNLYGTALCASKAGARQTIPQGYQLVVITPLCSIIRTLLIKPTQLYSGFNENADLTQSAKTVTPAFTALKSTVVSAVIGEERFM